MNALDHLAVTDEMLDAMAVLLNATQQQCASATNQKEHTLKAIALTASLFMTAPELMYRMFAETPMFQTDGQPGVTPWSRAMTATLCRILEGESTESIADEMQERIAKGGKP